MLAAGATVAPYEFDHAACRFPRFRRDQDRPFRAATSARCCSSSPILPASGSASIRRRSSPSLTEREQLGSTGFGQGVAIPHGKIEGLTQIYGLFARLARAGRLQGDRRPAGRPRLPAAVAARRRRRASEGAGGDQPGDAPRGDAREDARRAQPRCAGRGADGRRRARRRLSGEPPARPTSKSPASCAGSQAEGDFATVLRKGDPDRGSLLLVVSSRGQSRRLPRAHPGLDGDLSLAGASGRPNRRVPPKSRISSRKRARFDEDLWAIELDIADAGTVHR